jgi:hypothetical protein
MFLFLLLLSIPKEIFGIYCIYSEVPLELPFDNFNLSDFEMSIDTLPSYDYKDDNIDMCRLEIYVDYNNRSLVISFADSFEWSQLDDGEGRLDLLIVLNQSNTEVQIYNILEYACYDRNECDKLFLFNHINWLREVNYTIFQEHLSSLLSSKSNPTGKIYFFLFDLHNLIYDLEYCFTDKINPFKCPNGFCSGKYFKNYRNYLFECIENYEPSVEVHITTNMIIEKNSLNIINLQESQIIRYTCIFNVCNSQLLTDSLVKVVDIYYLKPLQNILIQLYQGYDFQNSNLTDPITFSPSKTTIREDIPSNIANKTFLYFNQSFFFIFLFILFDI